MTVEEINNIAKLLALTPTQRERFHELMQPHMPKVSAVDSRRPGPPLSADVAAQLSALKSSISAADSLRLDPDRGPALNWVKAQLQRWHYPWKDDAVIDPIKLDQVLASSGADPTSRIALKIEMGKLNLLPRLS
jgi:hypothetical protein